jgi:hypothetical protein
MYFWDLLRSFGLQKTMDFPMKNMDFVRENDRKPWISPWKTRILSSTFPWVRTKLRLVLGDVLPKGSDLANGLESDLLQEDALAESHQKPDISVMRYLKMCFFRKIMLKWIMENPIEMIIKQCFFFQIYIYIWYIYIYLWANHVPYSCWQMLANLAVAKHFIVLVAIPTPECLNGLFLVFNLTFAIFCSGTRWLNAQLPQLTFNSPRFLGLSWCNSWRFWPFRNDSNF